LVKLLQKAQDESAELRKQVTNLESQLRDIQVMSFRQISDSSWTTLEDQAIETFLKQIDGDIEFWSEGYCVKDFKSLRSLTAEDAEMLMRLTSGVAYSPLPGVDQICYWSQEPWAENAEGNLDPAKILKALLTRRMFRDIADNPFLLIDALHPKNDEDRAQQETVDSGQNISHTIGDLTQDTSKGLSTIYRSLQRSKWPVITGAF
jgi:hypothetical protein